MEDFDGVLLVELYRDSTDSYMETIVPKETIIDPLFSGVNRTFRSTWLSLFNS